MASFHEVQFPVGISLGATGGPERRTEVVTLGSGFEERNQRWANSRCSYNAGFGVKSVDDLAMVKAFWEERRGKLTAFRWKDWSDFKSGLPVSTVSALDVAIGTGDAANTDFQLVKRYGVAFNPWVRTITKPVPGSVRVAVAGVELTNGWTVETTTGVVTFTTPPADGATITAGFEFDVPARFDSDKLDINLESFAIGSIPQIPIIEVRIPEATWVLA